MPCASLELCALMGVVGGQVALCRGQIGRGCGGPSFLEVREDAGHWDVEDELSDCWRPCRGCCRERAAALGTAGELGVTSAKGRPGVGSVGSGLSRVGGPGGGELEDTVSPGHASWGPSQQSIRGATGKGAPLLWRGNSGSPVGGARDGGSCPVEGAGPPPAVTRIPRGGSGGGTSVVEGQL